MNFQRLENLMYKCKFHLFWWDEETDQIDDWTDAEIVDIKDGEIYLKKDGFYRSWDIETLEAYIEKLIEDHNASDYMSLYAIDKLLA